MKIWWKWMGFLLPEPHCCALLVYFGGIGPWLDRSQRAFLRWVEVTHTHILRPNLHVLFQEEEASKQVGQPSLFIDRGVRFMFLVEPDSSYLSCRRISPPRRVSPSAFCSVVWSGFKSAALWQSGTELNPAPGRGSAGVLGWAGPW